MNRITINFSVPTNITAISISEDNVAINFVEIPINSINREILESLR